MDYGVRTQMSKDKFKELVKEFITDTLNGEIFNESVNDVRFIYPDHSLKDKFNEVIEQKIKDEIISSFIDFLIQKGVDEYIPAYTITINNTDENLIIIIGF